MRLLCCCVALVGLVQLGHVRPASGQTGTASLNQRLSVLERDAAKIQGELDFLWRGYATLRAFGRTAIARRLSAGMVNYLLKDYVRAAIVLFDIAENRHFVGRPAWYEAVYYLAESLYKNRNFVGARRYYETLVKRRGRFYQRSLIRLMEIAEKTGKYGGLDRYFGALTRLRSNTLRSKVYYLRAKSLYSQGRHGAARANFVRIPAGDPYHLRAQYFVAVILIQTKTTPAPQRNQRAIRILSAALRSTPKRKGDARVRELIHLSLGRLYFEVGDMTRANTWYLQIPRQSPYFDDALYEVCWTHVRTAQREKNQRKAARAFKRALRALELLLAFVPDSPFVAEARLLRGNLLLKASSFKKAMATYQKVVDRYSRVREVMNRILERHTDPAVYFKKLTIAHLQKMDTSTLLPKEAIKWMTSEKLMARVLVMLGDLRTSRNYIDQASRIVSKVERALALRDRIDLSPTLKEGRLKGVALTTRLSMLRDRANRIIAEASTHSMTATERVAYMKMRRRRVALETLVRRLPRTRSDFRVRSKTITKRLLAVAQRIHRTKIRIAYVGRTASAARWWLANSPAARRLSSVERATLRQKIEALDRTVIRLKAEQARLAREVDLSKVTLGVGASTPQREEELRRKYRKLLAEERAFLAKIRSRLPPSEAALSSRANQLGVRIEGLQRKLDKYFLRLKQIIDRKTGELQTVLNKEKQRLDAHRSQVETLVGDSRALAARIARDTFLAVRGRFKNLVLRADVGIIDVTWQEKEARRKQRDELLKERGSELRVLDQEFRQILRQVD